MKSFLAFLLSGSHVTLNKGEKEKVQDMTAKLNSWHSYFSKLKNKDAKERKARIGKIVQNVECIETLARDERLIYKFKAMDGGSCKRRNFESGKIHLLQEMLPYDADSLQEQPTSRCCHKHDL